MKHLSLLHSFILFTFSFFTLCAISGCSKSEDDEISNENSTSNIVGLWYEEGMSSTDKDFTIYHFKDNGTMIEYYAITSTGYYADTYTYKQNNKSLKITDDWGETEAYEIKSLSSSKLILFDIAYEEELVFVRYHGNIPNGTQHNGNQGGEENWNDNNNEDQTPSTSYLDFPKGVQASANNGIVTITWKVVDGASSYSVWRCSTATGAYTKITTTYGTSATDYSPLTGYNYYKVKAIGDGMESDFSYSASVNIKEEEEKPTLQKPAAPTGVSVSNEGNNYLPSAVIRWNEVDGAEEYYVYRSTSANGSYSKIATSKWNVYTDTNAPTTRTSYYKVKAVNSAGESAYSSYAEYTPVDPDKAFAPGAPIYGTCTVSGTRVTLRWSYPTGNGYGVPTKATLRAKLGGVNTWVDVKELSGTATSVTWDFSTGYVEFIDGQQFLYLGIVLENEKGTGSKPRIYNITQKKWVN